MADTFTRGGQHIRIVRETKAARFREEDHPRDRLGRFIETGAEVRILGGMLGKVLANVGGGRIEVQTSDGNTRVVHRNYLTVIKRPDGSAPTSKPDAAVAAPPAGVPTRPDAQHVPDPPSATNDADVKKSADDLVSRLMALPDPRARELAGRVDSEASAYTAALIDGTPDNEADERAALIATLDRLETAAPAAAGQIDQLRAHVSAEPPAPDAQTVGNASDVGLAPDPVDIAARLQAEGINVDGRQVQDWIDSHDDPSSPPPDTADVLEGMRADHGTDQAPDARSVPNSSGDPVNVAVGDTIVFHDDEQDKDLTGDVVGFTPNGGPLVKTDDGQQFPLLPDAASWDHHPSGWQQTPVSEDPLSRRQDAQWGRPTPAPAPVSTPPTPPGPAVPITGIGRPDTAPAPPTTPEPRRPETWGIARINLLRAHPMYDQGRADEAAGAPYDDSAAKDVEEQDAYWLGREEHTRRVMDTTEHPDAVLTGRHGGEYATPDEVYTAADALITRIGAEGGLDIQPFGIMLDLAAFEYAHDPSDNNRDWLKGILDELDAAPNGLPGSTAALRQVVGLPAPAAAPGPDPNTVAGMLPRVQAVLAGHHRPARVKDRVRLPSGAEGVVESIDTNGTAHVRRDVRFLTDPLEPYRLDQLTPIPRPRPAPVAPVQGQIPPADLTPKPNPTPDSVAAQLRSSNNPELARIAGVVQGGHLREAQRDIMFHQEAHARNLAGDDSIPAPGTPEEADQARRLIDALIADPNTPPDLTQEQPRPPTVPEPVRDPVPEPPLDDGSPPNPAERMLAEISHIGTIALKGTPEGTGTVSDPIAVGGDIERAARLIEQGKHVRLNQPQEVSTLVAKLADLVTEAKNRGEKVPIFDLCLVSVPGTNLFCEKNKGIPRARMPQLDGHALPGSPADALPKNDRGKVSIVAGFRKMLEDSGVAVTDKTVPAANLRATQSELGGATVAGMAISIRGGNGYGPDNPYKPARMFVTRDGYIVDGHHGWAAQIVVDAEDGTLGDRDMDVAEIDLDIGAVLDLSNEYARQQGIPQVAVGDHPTATGVYPQQPPMVPMLINVPAKWHLSKFIGADGKLTPERQALHDQIVTKVLDGVPEGKDTPTAYFLGGGMAAGKSTLVNSGDYTPPPGQAAMIAGDDFKAMLPEWQEGIANNDPNIAVTLHQESQMLTAEVRREAQRRKMDMVLDGVGNSDREWLRHSLMAAKEQGYRVRGLYVTLPTEMALDGAQQRGESTGRFVPPTSLIHSHASVSEVLPEAYDLFDELDIFDTTDAVKEMQRLRAEGADPSTATTKPKPIFKATGGRQEISDHAAYLAFLQKVEDRERLLRMVASWSPRANPSRPLTPAPA